MPNSVARAAAVTDEASRRREHLGNLQPQRFRAVPAPASAGCCASSNVWAPCSCATPAFCGGPQEGMQRPQKRRTARRSQSSRLARLRRAPRMTGNSVGRFQVRPQVGTYCAKTATTTSTTTTGSSIASASRQRSERAEQHHRGLDGLCSSAGRSLSAAGSPSARAPRARLRSQIARSVSQRMQWPAASTGRKRTSCLRTCKLMLVMPYSCEV
mmetsp:Transcript_76973/g.243246  ORF Transcript_76973/g.243246 Transcript_76973/m.243246 type:complete len:213 (-) Transcript_76973:875-1513(-)